MEITTKNEGLRFIISRYDIYMQSINAKGNFYLTINTFILGGTLAGYVNLNAKYHFCTLIFLLFISTLLINLLSVLLTLFAIKPYVNSKHENENGSIIFFGDVADYHSKQYDSHWQNIDDKKWHDDLKMQAFLLSKGLKIKFKLLSVATWLIAGEVLAVSVFGIYLISTISQ